jgi:hypothetical protein
MRWVVHRVNLCNQFVISLFTRPRIIKVETEEIFLALEVDDNRVTIYLTV